MNHAEHEDRAAACALGALDGSELAAFESHLAAGCARCESALHESRETLAALAREVPRAVPPPEVKATLLRRLGATGPAREPARAAPRWLPWAAAAAGAGLAAVVAATLVAARYEARLAALARDADVARAELAEARTALREREVVAGERARALADLLRDPATRLVTLRGTGPLPGAEGRVVWNDRAGGICW